MMQPPLEHDQPTTPRSASSILDRNRYHLGDIRCKQSAERYNHVQALWVIPLYRKYPPCTFGQSLLFVFIYLSLVTGCDVYASGSTTSQSISCGSAAEPCASLSDALYRASSEAIVCISGVVPFSGSNLRGTISRTRSITITGIAGGSSPKLRCTEGSSLSFTGASSVKFQHLEIEGCFGGDDHSIFASRITFLHFLNATLYSFNPISILNVVASQSVEITQSRWLGVSCLEVESQSFFMSNSNVTCRQGLRITSQDVKLTENWINGDITTGKIEENSVAAGGAIIRLNSITSPFKFRIGEKGANVTYNRFVGSHLNFNATRLNLSHNIYNGHSQLPPPPPDNTPALSVHIDDVITLYNETFNGMRMGHGDHVITLGGRGEAMVINCRFIKGDAISVLYSRCGGGLVVDGSHFDTDSGKRSIDVDADKLSFTNNTVVTSHTTVSTTEMVHHQGNTVICTKSTQFFREISWNVLGCRPCGNDSYTMYAIESGTMYANGTITNPQCFDCPSGFDCHRGEVALAEEMWGDVVGKEGKLDWFARRCPSKYCSSVIHRWNESCVNGRTGILCGSCPTNHSVALLSSSCVENSNCTLLWLLFIVLLPLAYLTFLLNLPAGDRSEWKSLVFFMQTYPLVAPDMTKSILSGVLLGTRGTELDDTSWRGTVCVGEDMTFRGKSFLRIGIVMAIPIMAGLGLAWRAGKRKLGPYRPLGPEEVEMEEAGKLEEISRVRNEKHLPWVNGLVAGTLFVFGNCLTVSLQLLFCVKIREDMRLFLDGEVQCYTPWQLLVGAFFTVVLVPFPGILLYVRAKLREKEGHSSGARRALLVLEGCYREKYRYWESVSIARRITLVVIVVIVQPPLRQYLILPLCVLFLAANLILHPIKNILGRWLENWCLFVLFLASLFDLLKEVTGETTGFIIAQVVIHTITFFVCVGCMVYTVRQPIMNMIRSVIQFFRSTET
ncbi:hypothetical protein PROFUN_01280 [Planoprotostelium fungivorum]|uniref:Uncharacterized protein n=1 Tax=Planoprotostelium fungivorum TaxID=1890364 RepID=A0A2P6NZP9_9EUKA|nr:hypothetical protein PROFUN_01280 [Planoprotostelium fungivorum]